MSIDDRLGNSPGKGIQDGEDLSAESVSLSKITMTTGKLLGRNTAGTGAVEEITLGTNLSFSGTTLNAAGGGGVSDGDKGDITVSSSGTVWTVDNTAITFAKMQDVSTGVLIGRSTASSGSMETLSVGTGLSLSGGTLSSSITQYTDEMAQDTIATLIQNGTGISWTYNDGANTLTPAVSLGSFSTTNLSEGSNLYFTDERAQDAVGTILTDSSTVDFTYNDGANTIAAAVIDNTSTQKIEVTKNSGAVVGTRKQLNFIEGTNVTLTIADDVGNDQVDITIAASGGGGVSDGDKGDISVTASGATWTIDSDVVTFAKMQNISTSRLLGRSTAASGDIEELTIGSGLSLSAGELSATGGGGGLSQAQVLARLSLRI